MAYVKEVRTKAHGMRKRGMSYDVITRALGVPKSTLSSWLGRHPYMPSNGRRQREHLARIRLIAAEAKRAQRQSWINASRHNGAQEAKKFSLTPQVNAKALLAMLYWAEGSKSDRDRLTFANTDPVLSGFYLSLLRTAYAIDEKRLHIRIHIHYYHSPKETLNFWSKLLHVPLSQFEQIYVKKRSTRKRFRQNFQGICFIKYFDQKIREELLALGRTLAERIVS